MDNPEFFLEVRKLTLEDNCSNILITGDFNTTLCPVKDRWNYTSDNHKKSRAVIQNWIDEGDYVDGHRAFFPENEKLFTYRKLENDEIIKQSRIDYSLSSVDLFNLIKKVEMVPVPQSLSDHNGIKTTIRVEELEDGPGTFRATPFIEADPAYAASTRHLINQELIELSDMERKDKFRETRLNNDIFQLTMRMNQNISTMEEQETLAIKISIQKTKREILMGDTSIPKQKCLDYIIHKVGRATKAYQNESKLQKDTRLVDLTEELGNARDHEDPNDDEIREIEEQINNLLEDICDTEKAKMKTYRMLYDEKPTRQMLSLEKKSCVDIQALGK